MVKYPLFLFFCTVLLLWGQNINAQFYSAGQDPASVRWMQINTDNFQVIFPKGYEEQAKYIADVLEWSYEYTSASLEHQPRKVSVIVHNQTVISNGFVSWAPSRAELYTTPPSDNDFHDWMERLIIHEFRHVVQVDKLNQGLTKVLGILLGEMGIGGVVGHIPLWFLEGDAVVAETEFTRAGRGRLPGFEQGLRAQVLTYGKYSYEKAVFGSYKNHVPNHYELGYQLVASARAEHGSNVWSPMLNNVARRPLAFYPFPAEMKRQFGQGLVQYYKSTFENLESAWSEQKEKHEYSEPTAIETKNKLYTSYQHPNWINDSTIVALKRGLKDIPTVVTIDMDGNEKSIFSPGTVFPNSIHYAAGKVVWAEHNPDPRWEHRNYSEIMVYNIHLRIYQRITQKGKFFSPALSPDGMHVAAVEISPESKYSLVILDALTGKETWRFAYPGNDLILQPAWHSNAEKLAIIALDDQGKRLDEIDLNSRNFNTIIHAENGDISSPSYFGDDIFINATWSGIDNIYLVKQTGETFLAVSSVFGAVNATTNNDGTRILYSDYSAHGYKLKTLPTDDFKYTPREQVENYSLALHKQYIAEETPVVGPDNVVRNEHSIKPYRRIANLLNLHSWFPAYADVNNLDFNPGASLFFQNKLSTSFAQLGYEWDLNDRVGKYIANYTYRGWYPVVELIADHGERRLYYTADDKTNNFLYKDDNYKLALSIPLRFQHLEYFYGITPWIQTGINQVSASRNTPDSIYVGNNRYFTFGETNFITQEYRLLAYRQRRSVARDIFPRDGQTLDINFRHTPWTGNDMGAVFSARGVIFFPGLVRHHGFRLTAGYQERFRAQNDRQPQTVSVFYSFGNLIPYPRGIVGHSHQNLVTGTVDYAFPLLYPDLSIPYLMYLKRIRTQVFYDYARGQRFPDSTNLGSGIREEFSSYGFRMMGDLNLFGFFAPMALGVQVAFPSIGSTNYEFIYNISF